MVCECVCECVNMCVCVCVCVRRPGGVWGRGRLVMVVVEIVFVTTECCYMDDNKLTII